MTPTTHHTLTQIDKTHDHVGVIEEVGVVVGRGGGGQRGAALAGQRRGAVVRHPGGVSVRSRR